ncbi:hypothetical protein CYMTET_12379 [Cymbomonas tetramitiformis]|uniref:Indole-3-glycerol-phosphate synthase n=1 Tax=Cymbomonas tetramitiformis TaxID=36881 RepID=A0AAE0LCH4_9CHLO|nr:hypothetical protein CYMTET_12379 [Cymbomonas tetramitiformis]|eukprot:gene30674-38394_t
MASLFGQTLQRFKKPRQIKCIDARWSYRGARSLSDGSAFEIKQTHRLRLPGNKCGALALFGNEDLKLKKDKVFEEVRRLGDEGAQAKIQTAKPRPDPYALQDLVEQFTWKGQGILVAEVPTVLPGANGVKGLTSTIVNAGAHALAVRTDDRQVLRDVVGASSAPVLWLEPVFHPLQVLDAAEDGAAGVFFLPDHQPLSELELMVGYARRLGLEAIVEISSRHQLAGDLEDRMGPCFSANCLWPLSIGIAGFGEDIADGILGELPYGSVAIVGSNSVDSVRVARSRGADVVVLHADAFVSTPSPHQLVDLALYALSGDD